MLHACSVVSDSFRPHGLQPARLLGPWNSPGRNTGRGCHSLLQGIFPTQGSNTCLLHWQVDSLPLSHWEAQYIERLEVTSQMLKIKLTKTDRLTKLENDNEIYSRHTAKSLQSCPTLCDPTDGSPLGSPIPGILQARTLEWVAISFSNACK